MSKRTCAQKRHEYRIHQIFLPFFTNFIYTIYYYLNRYMYFGCCYIQHHAQTIHPTENFISMNLLQMSCVIAWAWSFLTSKVVEAVRGQKHHISGHSMLGSSQSTSSAYQRFIKKWDQIWLSLHSASISWILGPSL